MQLISSQLILSVISVIFCINLHADESKVKLTTFKNQNIEGWIVRVDTQLLDDDDAQKTTRIIRSLAEKLSNIKTIIPEPHLSNLQKVKIVLEMAHPELVAMQYHEGVNWLKEKGYDVTLACCVHLPVAEALIERRQITDQPWVILHELSHAYHHQVIGFNEPRILKAYEKFKASGHGDRCLHISGKYVQHYGLTNHKEFFAEMTEAYFGSNDFYPFNRGELMQAEPEVYALIKAIWSPLPNKK